MDQPKKLSIATMVNGNVTAPAPFIYAPIELAINLSQALADRHNVTYFGPNGTKLDPRISVKTRSLEPLVSSEDEYQSAIMNADYGSHMRLGADDLYLAVEMYLQAAQGTYDILHFHHIHIPNSYARAFPDVPSITTLHDPLSEDIIKQIERSKSPNNLFVAISKKQMEAAPNLPYAGVVYNGIDTDFYRPLEDTTNKDDYLFWAARIVPEKGLEDAVETALRTGKKLKIAGPVYKGTRDYFDRVVSPHLTPDSDIEYLGAISPEQVVHHMQRASAFLMPIKWEEPFGLTVVEAMSCGTPVIAYSRGAVPETIMDGKTGFLVEPDSVEGLINAVDRLISIAPQDCRDHVVRNFSIASTAKAYEKIYKEVINS